MTESLGTWVGQWGYLAVFLGSLIEGESVILTAGVLSAQGYLSLWKIIAISFTGTLIADQSLFFVGYYFGHPLLRRFPKLKQPADRAFDLFHRYSTWYILIFRFIYGVRTISPIIIGASGICWRRFAWLNVAAAALWSVLSCSAGYFFGQILMRYLQSQQSWWAIICFILLFAGGILWKARKRITAWVQTCTRNKSNNK